MLECLEGFEKRMEFFAVVESIAKRTNKMEKIENQFEANQLDNLIMSVLTYIMEVTLAEEKECTLEDMVQFVREVLPFYGKQFSLEETEEITRYIVKDILQNKGTIRSYQVMNYKNDEQEISIRLIKDRINENHKIVYELPLWLSKRRIPGILKKNLRFCPGQAVFLCKQCEFPAYPGIRHRHIVTDRKSVV